MDTENAGGQNSRLSSYKHGVKSNAVSWHKIGGLLVLNGRCIPSHLIAFFFVTLIIIHRNSASVVTRWPLSSGRTRKRISCLNVATSLTRSRPFPHRCRKAMPRVRLRSNLRKLSAMSTAEILRRSLSPSKQPEKCLAGRRIHLLIRWSDLGWCRFA